MICGKCEYCEESIYMGVPHSCSLEDQPMSYTLKASRPGEHLRVYLCRTLAQAEELADTLETLGMSVSLFHREENGETREVFLQDSKVPKNLSKPENRYILSAFKPGQRVIWLAYVSLESVLGWAARYAREGYSVRIHKRQANGSYHELMSASPE